jgi:hypothetical protein
MESLFINATRKKYRYASNRGDLTIEQLWDLPLSSGNGFSLDSVARAVNSELKAESEDSFVATKPNPKKAELENKLDVVKAIIEIKIAEDKARTERAEKRRQRDLLLDAIAAKETEGLTQGSLDELKQRLAALDDA